MIFSGRGLKSRKSDEKSRREETKEKEIQTPGTIRYKTCLKHHPKKLKLTEISSFFSSPKKEAATDSESGESSEDSDSVQKKMDYSFKKEVDEGSSKHLQQEAEVKTHNFQYCFNRLKIFSVSCKTSMTVLEALNTSQMFRNEKDKKKNKQKEILVQRCKEGVPTAAVKTDFPCCLIETDEILYIDFIQKDENSCTNRTTADPSLRKTSMPETLVTFRVKKEGGQKVRRLLKSKALRRRVQYVCVYAFKGEKIKTALEHDGRFINDIFRKHCALSDELKHEWSNPVDNLDGKAFQLVVLSDKNQPDSQDDLTPVTTEPNAASDADVAETASSSQNPINTSEQEKKHDGNTKSTNPSIKWYATKPIADSKEILGILRDQFPVLLKQLKQREKLKNKSDVQKFFRAEYGKSVENFLKVKKVKQLMKLSDSVCQIRKGESALGTGFLLFDRYILTNAHVIGEPTDVPKVNAGQFTAVFGYEDLDSEDSKHIPVEQLTAYSYGMDDKGRYLDYALLELDDVENTAEYPKLLDCYRPNAPINRGQICIVGHPGEGVKKMDPCFIIERENRIEAANKHKTENQHLIQLMNEACSKEKWNFLANENQITYDSCFFHGSSGSPVFDVDCNLIGIHTGGYKYKTEGGKTWSFMEYGFSMQPILENISVQARMKDLTNIVSVIEAYSNVSGTAEQQNQIDIEMESAEESDEL